MFKLMTLLIYLIVQFIAVSVNWISYDDGKTYYHISDDKLNHDEAVEYCINIDGSLVRLKDYAVAERLATDITGNDDSYFIDLEDKIEGE